MNKFSKEPRLFFFSIILQNYLVHTLKNKLTHQLLCTPNHPETQTSKQRIKADNNNNKYFFALTEKIDISITISRTPYQVH